MSGKEPIRFYELIIDSLEGAISEQDYQLLMRKIREDREAAACYVEFLSIYTNLCFCSPTDISLNAGECGDNDAATGFDSAVWKALLETERTAPSVVIEKHVQEPPAPAVVYQPAPRQINRVSLYTAILTTAALLAILLFFHFSPVPTPPEVATLTGSVNADWGAVPHAMAKGARLTTNSGPICLNKGVAGLSFDSGVEVTIEGPAVFQIITPTEIQLEHGRLYSEVSSVGLGFTVQTFNSRIIDLGTEFGVQAFADGATELHVFKGKTALVAGAAALTKQAVDVNAGQARSVCADGSQVNSVGLKQGYFAQKISDSENLIWRGQNLSLASVVAGGDGFGGGQIASGIDPGTGEIHSKGVQADNRAGDRDYHAVESYPAVDGVFTPNGQTGATLVSSGGHSFEFPVTDHYYWSDITAYPYGVELTTGVATRIDVNGPGVQTSAHSGLIFMHSNAGITFDLRAIRRQLGGLNIAGFKALCGVGKTRQGMQASAFWILVDGQCVFHTQHDTEYKDAKAVYIPIRPEQEFLTLAVTDGGDENVFDWCAFADPELLIQK